jgi:hypothetical protein
VLTFDTSIGMMVNMIKTTTCDQCGWIHAELGLRHRCEFTTWKRLIIRAKRYLLETYGEEDDSILDAWSLLDTAGLNLIRAENADEEK